MPVSFRQSQRIGLRGTAFSSVIGDNGETVLIVDCTERFLGQPPGDGKGIIVMTDAGEYYLLYDCGVSLTVYPDGLVVSGLPPDWAVAQFASLDEFAGQPGPELDRGTAAVAGPQRVAVATVAKPRRAIVTTVARPRRAAVAAVSSSLRRSESSSCRSSTGAGAAAWAL